MSVVELTGLQTPVFATEITLSNGVDSVSDSADAKFQDAVKSILSNVLEPGYTPVVNSSMGKDSVTVKMAAMQALSLYNKKYDTNQKMIVATATCGGMESPVIAEYVKVQISKLKTYAQDKGLNIEVLEVSPTFSENYLLQMIGMKTIQTFAKGKAQCSIDVKQSPIKRMVKDLTDSSYVTILGTRFSESASRGKGMEKRNEGFDRVTTDANGRMTIPPIATMTDDEVFEIIRKASWQQMGISLYDTYECPVDAGAVVELYGMGSEYDCSTKAFLQGVDGEFETGASCDNMSGRFGCWTCGRCGVEDKKHLSISKQPSHSWLKMFLDVREALMATEYNYDVRTWLNKGVDKDGYAKISLGSYSPEFCKKLLQWTLTIRAETGYMTVSDQELLWLIIQWVRYGAPEPFEIVNIRNEILLGGKRYYPSKEDMTHHSKKPVPAPIRVKLADDDFDGSQNSYNYWNPSSNDGQFASEEDAKSFFESQWTENFFTKAFGVDFSALHKMAPSRQMQIALAWSGVSPQLSGFHEFSGRRAAATDKMIQRSNQLHRLGLRAHLGNRERLVSELMGCEFELVAVG